MTGLASYADKSYTAVRPRVCNDVFAADRPGTPLCHICLGRGDPRTYDQEIWCEKSSNSIASYGANSTSLSWTVIVFRTDRQTDVTAMTIACI